MRQVIIIHGGSTYDSYDEYRHALNTSKLDYERLKPTSNWHLWLRGQLPGDDILCPSMPNSSNAHFDEWCVMFEKLLPMLRTSGEVILIGHSLGAIFLTKYLSARELPVHLSKLILIAAPYDDESQESLGDFQLTTTPRLMDAADEVHLIHAEDDVVVAIGELEKYHYALPEASVHRLTTGNHFFDENFPYLLELIKK